MTPRHDVQAAPDLVREEGAFVVHRIGPETYSVALEKGTGIVITSLPTVCLFVKSARACAASASGYVLWIAALSLPSWIMEASAPRWEGSVRFRWGRRSVERAASLRLAALSRVPVGVVPRSGTTPPPYAFVTTMPKGVAPAGSDAGEDASSVRAPPSTLKIVTASIAASTT